ncbi:PREDICTED: olfactory receptor 12D2-like [Nanorana parkeri]|uniref:olfactory receptor 12D2-like n=1 Tax=Nanorana parkeri TaxID=125878 RepID=UPI0008546F01|nr:PREDICTED: olfactory receptor 12D2-like [Nanorana parkeri]
MTEEDTRALLPQFSFQWRPHSIRYLDIHLPLRLSDLYRCNFIPLLNLVKADLPSFSLRTLPWVGRINAVKMMILPKVFFLFQMLPIELPGSYFRTLARITSTYIRQNRAPRIAGRILVQTRRNGGLALPDFWAYHVAAQMVRVVDWVYGGSGKSWVSLETVVCGAPLQEVSMATQLKPLQGSDFLPLGRVDRSFAQWSESATLKLGDVLTGNESQIMLENCTSITYFALLGLTDIVKLQVILFAFFFMLYIINLIGNLSIMVVTIHDPSLHTPMYYFLWNLSLLDICYSSVTVPKMLADFFSCYKVISFAGCISQIHFFHFLGSTEVMLLTAMSYDRYVAIGNPLRYSNIMNSKLSRHLALGSWMTGYFHSLLHTVMTAKLPFCGPNLVNHFFCDIKPVLKLASADTSLNLKLLTRVTGTLATTTLLLTLLSYLFISKFLLKIQTAEGRKHAFSTCSAHLTVVFLLYGTAIFTYLRPSTQDSLEQDRAAAVLFTVITRALNPIIYTLRNKDMKKAMKKIVNISHF